MEEFILIMIGCLTLVLSLGVVLGILWSKAKRKEDLNEIYEDEEPTHLEELEALYLKEKELRVESDQKNRELKGQLIKKMTLLSSTSDTLKDIQSKRPTLESQEVINDLKDQLTMKNKELQEFEEVLCKAEETIEKLQDK